MNRKYCLLLFALFFLEYFFCEDNNNITYLEFSWPEIIYRHYMGEIRPYNVFSFII